MKTVLVPIDFSAASENAVEYTSNLIKDIPVDRVILLNSYFISTYTQVVPLAESSQFTTGDMQAERQEMELQLEELGARMDELCGASVQVITQVSELPLLRAIHETVRLEQVELLILGSDDKSSANQSLIGRQLIPIAKASRIPVLIVPSNVSYQKIERALIPCTLETIKRLNLLNKHQHIALWRQAELTLLNVNPSEKLNWEDSGLINGIKALLSDYTYQLQESDTPSIIHALHNYTEAHPVNLIFALSGKESFFHSLTHKNITDAIALSARQPVLLLKP